MVRWKCLLVEPNTPEHNPFHDLSTLARFSVSSSAWAIAWYSYTSFRIGRTWIMMSMAGSLVKSEANAARVRRLMRLRVTARFDTFFPTTTAPRAWPTRFSSSTNRNGPCETDRPLRWMREKSRSLSRAPWGNNEPLSTLSPASLEYVLATLGTHPFTKPVGFHALAPVVLLSWNHAYSIRIEKYRRECGVCPGEY